MTVTAWKTAGTINVGDAGYAWTGTGNTLTTNAAYASQSIDGWVDGGEYIIFTNFGFSVPSGETVSKIELEIVGNMQLGGGISANYVPDNNFFNEDPVTALPSSSTGAWDIAAEITSSDTTMTLPLLTADVLVDGVAPDTWAYTIWNNSTFGVWISSHGTTSNPTTGGLVELNLDRVRVRLTHDAAPINIAVDLSTVAVTTQAVTVAGGVAANIDVDLLAGAGEASDITFVGAGSVVSNGTLIGTSGLTLTPHASTLTDDIMVAVIHRNDELNNLWNALSGWDIVDQITTTAGQDMGSVVYYRIATSDSEGAATFINTDTTAEQTAGCILTYRGIDTTTPWDVAFNNPLHFISRTDKAATNVDAFDPITTVTDGAVVIAFEAVTHNDITSNADPAGYTNAVRNIGATPAQRQFQVWHKTVASAGVETPAAPAYTSNNTVAESHQWTLALRPLVIVADSSIETLLFDVTVDAAGGPATGVKNKQLLLGVG